MQFKKPKFVYFDLGNVLVHFDHEIACSNLARLCERSPDDIRRVVFESELQSRYEDGSITTEEFYEAFSDELDVQVDQDAVCRAASAIFWPNYSIIPVVAQLRLAGTSMGILSNTCEAHWDYIFDGRYKFVSELFGLFALSFRLKSAKPAPLIYEKACQQAGFQPSEIFFVDDRSENVAAAQECGLDAVQFEDSVKLTRDLQARGLLQSI